MESRIFSIIIYIHYTENDGPHPVAPDNKANK